MTRFDVVRRAILAERSLAAKLGWSVVAVALPTLVRWAIDRGANGGPFVTYFPVIVLAALLLGWRFATLITIGSAVVAQRLFIGGPWFADPSLERLMILALFALSAGLLIAIGTTLRRSVHELDKLTRLKDRLNDELQHRVKNTLAVVQALVRLSREHLQTGDFEEVLAGRIEALAKAHRMLGEEEWATGRLPELVDEVIRPFRRGANFAVSGEPTTVPPQACVPLTLALHELCINALKYGALSRPEGRVTIAWHCDPADPAVTRLSWREEGGPAVVAPGRRGLGTRLLQPQPGLAAVDLRFEPAGVECEIAL